MRAGRKPSGMVGEIQNSVRCATTPTCNRHHVFNVAMSSPSSIVVFYSGVCCRHHCSPVVDCPTPIVAGRVTAGSDTGSAPREAPRAQAEGLGFWSCRERQRASAASHWSAEPGRRIEEQKNGEMKQKKKKRKERERERESERARERESERAREREGDRERERESEREREREMLTTEKQTDKHVD